MSDKAPSDEAVEMKVTLYQCPVCLDRPTLGPVSRGAWSCLNGHPEVDAAPIEFIPLALLADEREAREKLVEALREIAEHKPQSIGTREVHDGEDWKQAEYFEPFAWKHAIGIARAALSEAGEAGR